MNKEVKKRLLWLSEHKTEDVKEDITYTLDYIRELEREIERLKAIVEGTKENRNELQEEIERLKEEYMILQNASDEVEEEKDREIERLNNIINELENLIKEDIITNLCEIENKRIGYGQTEEDKIWLKNLWGFKKYIISKCDEISKRS